VIITEGFPRKPLLSRAVGRLARPSVQFRPNHRKQGPTDTWWRFSPEVLIAFIGVLGFTDVRVTRHSQKHNGKPRPCYTIVGRREHRQRV